MTHDDSFIYVRTYVGSGATSAALWVAAFAVAAFLTLSFGIPAKFGPECVVVVGVDLSGGCVGDGELSVTLAEGTVAAVVLVAALDLAAFDAVFVLDKLTDAHVTVSPSGAFKAVFVGFANNIEFVNWSTMTWV